MPTLKRCSPASTIITDVFGGMLPRFSATIVSSCTLLSSSILNLSIRGFAVNLLCESTNFLFKKTEIESSSISPLSYNFTVTLGSVITSVCASLFSLVLRMLGVITGVWSGILVISGVFFLSESGLTFVGCSFTLFLFSAVAEFCFLPAGGFDFGMVVFLVTGGEVTG